MSNTEVTSSLPPLRGTEGVSSLRGTERVSATRVSASTRLLSLDVLRGLTVACMVLVNNGADPSYSTLGHSVWNGMTPCDLVFPFFLFMVGVSIFLSLSRHAGEPGMVTRILRRTLLLFVIGVALHAWDMLISGEAGMIPSHLRFWGVLQRIAICYCLASLFFIAFKGKYMWRFSILLLVIYAVVIVLCNGYSFDPNENYIGRIDRSIFGDHLYHKVLKGTQPVDPEGLLGIIPSVAHTLIGVLCGRALMRSKETTERIMNILVIAVTLGIVGYLATFAYPLNKRIWSPSYTLVTCSFAAGALGLLTWFIDLKGHNRWCRIFQMFGVNAFFIYVVSEMFPAIFSVSGIGDAIVAFWRMIIPVPEIASLCYALTCVALMGLVAWLLFRKKIYIKI